MHTKLFMKKIWNDLSNYASKEQAFFVFLYVSFLSYLKNRDSNALLEYKESTPLNPKQLQELFKNIDDSDLRNSVKEFEESIDWKTFLTQPQCKYNLQELSTAFEDIIQDINHLEEIISALEELSPQLDGLDFTPTSINQLVSAMPVNSETASIAELYCGLSGTGLTIFQKLSTENSSLYLTGEEQRRLYCNISRIRMFCHGITFPKVIQHDILQAESCETYDLVIADLPKSRNETINVQAQSDFVGTKTKIFTEWVAIQKVLRRVSPRGRAMVIATKGALVRQREKSIREILTQHDWLEAVITLPANLYASTPLSYELLIFNKMKTATFQNKVFFANINEEECVKSSLYKIPQNTILHLKEAYENLENVDFSAVASLQEIEKNDFSWNPFLYLQQKQTIKKKQKTLKLGEIADIMRGAQISKEEEIQLSQQPATHYWLNIRNIENGTISFDRCSMLSPRSSDWEEKFEIQEDDIILTSKGAVLKVCIVEPDVPKAFLCGNLTRIRVKKEHYSPYVLYEFLNSQEGRAVLESIQSGTTIKVLNNTNLREMPIPAYQNVKEKGEVLRQLYQDYRITMRKLQSDFETKRKKLLKEL